MPKNYKKNVHFYQKQIKINYINMQNQTTIKTQ